MMQNGHEFDTHAMASKLRAAGFNEAMASAVTYAVRDIAMSNVATRSDVKDAVHSMTIRLGAVAVFIITAIGVIVTIN